MGKRVVNDATLNDYEFFDKNGEPITADEWVTVFKWKDYFRLFDKVNGYMILTNWMGVDGPTAEERLSKKFFFQKWEPNKPPMINQTIVWDADGEMVASYRYPNSKEATAKHNELVEQYK